MYDLSLDLTPDTFASGPLYVHLDDETGNVLAVIFGDLIVKFSSRSLSFKEVINAPVALEVFRHRPHSILIFSSEV